MGFAMEDAIVFARIIECNPEEPISTLCATYESLRRSTIDSGVQGGGVSLGWSQRQGQIRGSTYR